MIREKNTNEIVLRTLEKLVDKSTDLLAPNLSHFLTVQMRYQNIADRNWSLKNKDSVMLRMVKKEGPIIYNFLFIASNYSDMYLLKKGISEKIRKEMDANLYRINSAFLDLKDPPYSFHYEVENCAPFGRAVNLSIYDKRRESAGGEIGPDYWIHFNSDWRNVPKSVKKTTKPLFDWLKKEVRPTCDFCYKRKNILWRYKPK